MIIDILIAVMVFICAALACGVLAIFFLAAKHWNPEEWDDWPYDGLAPRKPKE